MIYILNAFSLSMLPESTGGVVVRVHPLENASDAREFLSRAARYSQDITSAVGHASTAALFSRELTRDMVANRVSVTLDPRGNDMALVGQYRGPRLAEGVTELPEGAEIAWHTVSVEFSNPQDHWRS